MGQKVGASPEKKKPHQHGWGSWKAGRLVLGRARTRTREGQAGKRGLGNCRQHNTSSKTHHNGASLSLSLCSGWFPRAVDADLDSAWKRPVYQVHPGQRLQRPPPMHVLGQEGKDAALRIRFLSSAHESRKDALVSFLSLEAGG